MSEDKLNLARLKKAGHTFELSIDPELALQFRKNPNEDLRDIIKAEGVYTDAKKGTLASESLLMDIFQTADFNKVAKIILLEGEIQLTSEQRAKKREQKKLQIINFIHKNAIDPQTGYPHPPQRIEAAMEQAKIHVEEHKSIDEQVEQIISKLRPIIPLKIEQKKLEITIPPAYAAKSYSLVKKYGKFLQENWNSDGSWSVKLEIPAGLQHELIDKLNSFTHGEVIINL
ncbi:ribosome assembly factor SBDS [Candidatus Woesearchaeota archaeon]|jgi:ribosome maturation protein SDO1|nr:ribosome assembly factor SBDS [Candidatus Woesearchaeota archaeon]